jgi:hypothetical protein
MKEYHFTTIHSLIADLPAYAAIAWLNFSNLLVDVNLPQWEEFLFMHGWLILLLLRVANIIYDFYMKIEFDKTNQEGGEKGAEIKSSLLHKFIKYIQDLFKK